jgi:hypothetical protein
VLISGWRLTGDIWREQIERQHTQGSRSGLVKSGDRSPHDLERLHVEPAVLVGWSRGAKDVGAYVGRFVERLDGTLRTAFDFPQVYTLETVVAIDLRCE